TQYSHADKRKMKMHSKSPTTQNAVKGRKTQPLSTSIVPAAWRRLAKSMGSQKLCLKNDDGN
ncbi:MAG TPA: hypothetical protein VFR19_13695, partial [Hyphomicrobiaceae bacterium]|nr:hypothetical protein [Hyphomicrobiaceae bacterium]